MSTECSREIGLRNQRQGGRPTTQVVAVRPVAADVGVVTPGDDVALLPALENEAGAFVAPGEAGIAELPDPCEDVLLLGVESLELVDVSSDVGAACVNNREIPLMPSTDPVWMLEIGLHGLLLFGAGV